MKAPGLLFAIAAVIGLFVLLGSFSASADGVLVFDAGPGGDGNNRIHTCAVTSGGELWCWGYNGSGELGIGITSSPSHRPLQVCADASCSSHLVGVSAITAGDEHTCAISSDTTVECWGDNSYGQLGIGVSGGNSTIPVGVCENAICSISLRGVSVSGNTTHTCAVTATGGAKCWGGNGRGRLGDGTQSLRTAPVDVTGLTSGVAMVATAHGHTCALTTDGGVKCWGNKADGRLGNGEPDCCTGATTPQDVLGLTGGVTMIDTLAAHTCALTDGGSVKCWGSNSSGQLGDGSRGNSRSTPVSVTGLSTGVLAIATGESHTCALMVSGGVKCWGANGSGQLGDGTTTERDTPVDVQGLTSGVAAITAGFNYMCAVMAKGGAVCWGGNSYGQLGNGETTGRTSPVAVVDLKGTPTPTRTPPRTPTRTPTPSSLNGDVNCDRIVNSIDAALVLQHSAGLVSSLSCQGSADVNHDGNVNAVDAAIILQYVAGLIHDLPG